MRVREDVQLQEKESIENEMRKWRRRTKGETSEWVSSHTLDIHVKM